MVGVEALSRFVSDDGAGAELWFAEAAAVGLGANLEFSALGSAAAAAANLPPHLYVSLNISPTSCIDPRLPELFDHIELPINRIVLELTEGIPDEEYSHFISAITPLRERGLRIAIDDSHSGAGALSRMVHLRPDFIKLGANMISGVDRDPTQQALAACMVDFAEQIGTVLVAEGVETAEELQVLTELGFSAGQGYLLGRPSVRPKDWAAWNTAMDPDGIIRHLSDPAERLARRAARQQPTSADAVAVELAEPGSGKLSDQPCYSLVPLVPAHLVLHRRGFPGRHSPARLQAGDVSLARVRVGRPAESFGVRCLIRAGVGVSRRAGQGWRDHFPDGSCSWCWFLPGQAAAAPSALD